MSGKIVYIVIVALCQFLLTAKLLGIPSRMTPLKKAAADGKLAVVKRLIAEGVDPNGELDHGLTPLHWAAFQGRYEVVAYLLEQGVDVNLIRMDAHHWNENGTALHSAAAHGRTRITELLLHHGAKVGIRDYDRGDTPLARAVRGGHPETAALLIDHNALKIDDQEESIKLLHIAAMQGSQQLAKLLLATGVDVNAKSRKGVTALDVATQGYQRNLAFFLLEQGATIQTPHTVVFLGNKKKLQEFFTRNGNKSLRDTRKRTPIFYAAQKDTALYLLSQGAAIDIKDQRGKTPLYYLTRYGYREAARLLIRAGARIDQDMALEAVRKGRTEILELFLQTGFTPDPNDASYLIGAVAFRQPRMITYLLDKGMNIDAVAKNDYTPIQLAVLFKIPNITALLISRGADLHRTHAQNGWTLMHTAAYRGNQTIVELLLRHNLDPRTPDTQGVTPLDLARKYGHQKIIQLLEPFSGKK